MPLRRYIFNTLTVVSLLLLLGTVGLWVRSYRHMDDINFLQANGQRNCAFHSAWGTLTYWRRHEWNETTSVEYEHWLLVKPAYSADTSYLVKRFLIGFEHGSDASRASTSAPHWLFVMVFTTLPAIWLFKWNKRRKLGPNACPSCGYDLTGNESGVCPECGGSGF